MSRVPASVPFPFFSLRFLCFLLLSAFRSLVLFNRRIKLPIDLARRR